MDYYGETIEGQPCTDWKGIQAECAKHPQFVIRVEKYDEDREITNQMFAYLHAVVFPTLAQHWDCSEAEAELRCKRQWGAHWMIRRELGYVFILSKTVLTTKQGCKWIENIWEGAHNDGCIISPPDKDWRETARKMAELRGKDARPEPNLSNP
ncbi:MAG: hypothetical protein PHU85_13440 [Phycisphaerae bacterium]|nr:hypothetical protein [Phycisphaerae bacterium]